jgi:hypothetical protein
MTQAAALSPEYVLLGFLNQQPAHGYDLHERMEAELGQIWHISLNTVCFGRWLLYCLNGAYVKTLARNDWAVAEAYGLAGMKPHFVRIACPSAEST